MKSFSAFFVLFSVGVVGCNGAEVPIGERDQSLSSTVGQGDGGSGDASTGAALPTCEAPSGAVHAYTSVADTEAHIAGTWLLCAGSILSPADTAGIQIGGGSAHFLVKQGQSLVNGTTPAYDRTLSVLDTTSMNGPGAYQINLEQPGVGTSMYTSRTSEDGRFLELDEGTSGGQARYVRVPTCEIVGTPHAYASVADVASRISGKWSVCAGGITSPADTKGIELEAAHAYFLVGTPLARGPGWDYERDVAIIDTTSMNGPGFYQLNLSTGGGTNMYFTRISESGDVLELDEGTSGKKVVYRRETL